MKRFLITLLIFISALGCFAESKIGQYFDAYTKHTYDIDVRLKNDNVEYVYIYMGTKSGCTGYFNIKGKDLPEFVDGLKAIRAKYVEWVNTAKENNVVSITKDFDVKLPKGNLFWLGTQTWMANGQRLTPTFVLTNNTPVIVVLGYAKALQNKYIDETFNIAFSNLEMLDNFINILEPSNALEKAKAVQGLDSLFK